MVNAEVILFPDAEAVVIAYLATELHPRYPTIVVITKVPTDRPDQFVRVMRTGGVQRDMVTDTPQIVVEAWSTSEPDALALAQFCRGLVHAASRAGAMGGTVVQDLTELAGPSNLPDPNTGQYRYTATYAIELRGDVA